MRSIALWLSAGIMAGAQPEPLLAQPSVTSPEQLAATRELFYVHAHGGHRSRTSQPYEEFRAELICTDTGTIGDRIVHYPLSIPAHLTLERVQVWAYDGRDQDRMRVRVLNICQLTDFVEPQVLVLSSAQAPEGPSDILFDLSVGVYLNLPGCVQTVEVRMASEGEPCVDVDRAITRVRAQAFDPQHIFRDGFIPRIDVAQLHLTGDEP